MKKSTNHKDKYSKKHVEHIANRIDKHIGKVGKIRYYNYACSQMDDYVEKYRKEVWRDLEDFNISQSMKGFIHSIYYSEKRLLTNNI